MVHVITSTSVVNTREQDHSEEEKLKLSSEA